jgi:hypothetical protein
VIGLAQQLLRLQVALLREIAHADAARHLQAQPVDDDRRSNRAQQALDQGLAGRCRGEIGEDGGELVATQPRDRVHIAQRGAHPARDLDQQPVTDLVAMGVVDRLETIQIDVGEREELVIAPHPPHVLAQPVGEQRPVRQAGQGVVPGDVLERALRLDQRRDRVRELPIAA